MRRELTAGCARSSPRAATGCSARGPRGALRDGREGDGRGPQCRRHRLGIVTEPEAWAWRAQRRAAIRASGDPQEPRRYLVLSVFGHGLVLAALLWMPTPEPAELPGVLTVDLFAMATPAAAGKPAPLPKPVRAKPLPPAPTPAAEPVPPAPKIAEAPKPAPPKPEPPKPEPLKPPPPPPPKNETVI
jgi:hypothetical protein